jgi:hypothetical protein
LFFAHYCGSSIRRHHNLEQRVGDIVLRHPAWR